VFHRSEPIKKLELVKIKLKMLPQITGKEYGGGGMIYSPIIAMRLERVGRDLLEPNKY
jgi:hypothetical protein